MYDYYCYYYYYYYYYYYEYYDYDYDYDYHPPLLNIIDEFYLPCFGSVPCGLVAFVC